ncbi:MULTISPECIES: DUF1702 family protein [unclassified Micromonospora]|uniref:DUF1702 family protein n=1 Tax=unclassified Micromonospora TaxID=2617518 RepID=UPI001C5D34DB|nr:DUF1702 family protein [Micromonospora sp. RL09-050-HVF-A]MBW4701516.1 DUF1702 family protein [Micromonospora sp. RL09-050-HVF-A]
MSNTFRRLRRRILTPSLSETKLDVRGFHRKDPAAVELLETVGESFLTGYAAAAEAREPADAEPALEAVRAQFRGFAYEGAAMGFAVLDALPGGRSDRVATFLSGRGADHVYMAYVGVGWAMARVPRFRWSKLSAPDPLLRWLVLDGYGFHQAYFHTRRYVHEHYQESDFPWPADGPRWYAQRAIDQGIGRAMWFVGGTDAAVVADLIDRFPAERRADLYGGAGLAATYAGGVDADELRVFLDRAGSHRAQVAQGSAFAATARLTAGLQTPHTARATAVLAGTTPAEADRICAAQRPTGADSPLEPAYEVWRRAIADELRVRGRH